MFYAIMSSKARVDGRLFLAAIPDAAIAAKIFRLAGILKRAHKFCGELIAADRLHVSLFFLGALRAGEDCAICHEHGATLPIPPFEVSFDRTATFGRQPGNRPFVLFGGDGLSQLKSFRQQLGVELGLKRAANRKFEPHVTLLYDQLHAGEYPLGEPIAWTVNNVVLVHSLNGHEHVAKWRLVG